MQLCRSKLLTFYCFGSIFIPFWKFYDVNNQEYLRNADCFRKKIADDVFPYLEVSWWLLLLLFKSIKRHSLYIHPIWCFSSFISRNKQNKNKWLRLRWLRQRLAEAETETSHHLAVAKSNSKSENNSEKEKFLLNETEQISSVTIGSKSHMSVLAFQFIFYQTKD